MTRWSVPCGPRTRFADALDATKRVFHGEAPLASVLAGLPKLDEKDDATATNDDVAHYRRTTKGEYDAIVAAAASDTAAPRQERSLTARRVAPSAPVALKDIGGKTPKPVEMRRVGDAEWRWFGSRKDAAKAFGIGGSDVSRLINSPSLGQALRRSFEARPARAPPPRKRERPTKKKDGRKMAKTVEGARQKKNGKWSNTVMFPGREFDDFDAYRAAKKQRYARREEYREQNGIHR